MNLTSGWMQKERYQLSKTEDEGREETAKQVK